MIATLHGTNDDEWVMLGNRHDAWVFGAADPGSGKSAMLETARAFGELAKSGWKPRRTIVICHWDAEEPGLIGSTESVEEHRAELQAKAIVYINTDVGVTGPNFVASATPSLKDLVRDATRDVQDPETGGSVYDAWREAASHVSKAETGMQRQTVPRNCPVSRRWARSERDRISPFLDFAGIAVGRLEFRRRLRSLPFDLRRSLLDEAFWRIRTLSTTLRWRACWAPIALRLVSRICAL